MQEDPRNSVVRKHQVTQQPVASIVIPTLNEARYISMTLDGIIQNGIFLDRIRILVVDGGSLDGTIELVQSYCDRWPTIFELVVKEGFTVYQAIEFALANADTEYFVRVDARSFIPPGYIEQCIEHLQREEVVGAGGVQKQVGTTPIALAAAVATSHPFGVGNASFRLGKISGYADTVYLGAYRTVDLRRVGGYDADSRFLSEDASINAKLREAGGRIYLDANLKVEYPAKENLQALARQYLIYGAAKATYFLTNKKLTSIRQVIPILYLLLLLAVAVASPFFVFAGYAFIFLILVYAVTDIAVSARLAWLHKNVAFYDLIKVFAAIHFAWPLGFLWRFLFGERRLSRFLGK